MPEAIPETRHGAPARVLLHLPPLRLGLLVLLAPLRLGKRKFQSTSTADHPPNSRPKRPTNRAHPGLGSARNDVPTREGAGSTKPTRTPWFVMPAAVQRSILARGGSSTPRSQKDCSPRLPESYSASSEVVPKLPKRWSNNGGKVVSGAEIRPKFDPNRPLLAPSWPKLIDFEQNLAKFD